MIVKPFGENAIIVEFKSEISKSVHANVMRFYHDLRNEIGEIITYSIPAYNSLTIGFDSCKIDQKSLISKILGVSPTNVDTTTMLKSRKIEIPICYETPYGKDMDEISTILGVPTEDIIRIHSNRPYDVFMLGFLPGFPYMGITDAKLKIDRRNKPRLKVPKGSVGLAGRQTGIYPSEAPGGWQIIGRTPIPIFNSSLDDPFFIDAGDQIVFSPINADEFEQIKINIELGTFSLDSLISAYD